jgi:hypothetical protein
LIESDVHRSDALHGARRWVQDVHAGLEYEAIHPDRILKIKYEELVMNPETVMRRVTRHLGLGYLPEMLEKREGRKSYSDFYENIHANLDQELSNHHVEKWRERLNPQQITLIQSQASKLMEKLGYEPERLSQPAKPDMLFALRLKRAMNLFPQFLRYFRYRRAYLFYLLYRKARLGLLKDFIWQVHY